MIRPSDQRLPESAVRILVVDDHLAMRSALRVELSAHPLWQVCGEAQNGKEALEKVQKLRPDLVILDISMPVVDGFVTSRELRRIAPDIKILLNSVHDSPWLEAAAKDAGADSIACKSQIASSLTSTIERLVRRSCV